MLPLITLQATELRHFDSDLNTAALLPSEATELSGSFAELLELGLNEMPELASFNGQELPTSGEPLPPMPLLTPPDVDLLSRGPLEPLPEMVLDELPAEPVPTIPVPLVVPTTEPPLRSMPETPLARTGPAEPVVRIGNTGERLAQSSLTNSQSASIEHAVINLTADDKPRRPLPPGAGLAKDPIARLPVAAPPGTQLPAPMRRLNTIAQPAAATERLPEFEDARARTPSAFLPAAKMPSRTLADVIPLQGIADAPLQELLPQITPASNNLQAALPEMQATAPGQVTLAQPGATTPGGSAMAINTPLQDASWGERMGERVLVLASNKQQNAEIRLSPAELGPMRVKITVEDGTTHVTFHAQHAVTREAIEQALPRLRELLTENGLTLGQASVSEQGVQHGLPDTYRDAQAELAGGTTEQGEELLEEAQSQHLVTAGADGLLDTFV